MPNYSDSASLDFLFKHPAEAQRFWARAGESYTEADPHQGFEVMRQLCARQLSLGRTAMIITTNIDGMAREVLQQEPSVATPVLEIHGSLQEWQCGGIRNDTARYPMMLRERCGTDLFSMSAVRDEITRSHDESGEQSNSTYAKCPSCSQRILRPHLCLLGDRNKKISKS
jgi:NAD-dependent SIR2 family protein deacetylase